MTPRWRKVALELGYASEKLMWEDLHTKFNMTELALRFGVSMHAISHALRRCGVQTIRRSREQMALSEARALQKEGIADAARRLGVPYNKLYARVAWTLKLALKRRRQQNAAKRS